MFDMSVYNFTSFAPYIYFFCLVLRFKVFLQFCDTEYDRLKKTNDSNFFCT